jgi:hypothetical protein
MFWKPGSVTLKNLRFSSRGDEELEGEKPVEVDRCPHPLLLSAKLNDYALFITVSVIRSTAVAGLFQRPANDSGSDQHRRMN